MAAPANTPQRDHLGDPLADRDSSLTTEDSLPKGGPKRKRPAGTHLWRPGRLAGALWRWLPMIAVRLLALLGLALVVFAVVMVFVALQDQDNPTKVELQGKQLYVAGQPYVVRGVNYNPIFKGHDGRLPPYGEYFGSDYSESSFFSRSLSTFYTPDSFWQGIANIFTPPPSYHEAHLRELSKTFNTIRIYQWSRDVSHRAFLDLCHRLGVMVIVTFQMDPGIYPDLTNKDTIADVETDFRHVVRVHKGHPAVLMWAISNEPNANKPDTYAGDLAPFFQIIQRLRSIRDDEEGWGRYYPHPMVVPMADETDLLQQIQTYNYAAHDVWGVNAYRGFTFGTLFTDYTSNKPLLISEFGMDAYDDVITSPAMASAFDLDANNSQAGEAQQNQAVVQLARLVEAQNSHTTAGASCIGGLVFEYTDEWWKGVSTDAFHQNCFLDNASIQSTCGYTSTGAAPDNRLNEELFGLLRVSYPARYLMQLTPRPAYTSLSAYWQPLGLAASGAANASAVNASRRVARIITLEPPQPYQAIFPTTFTSFPEALYLWLVIPATAMLLFGLLPYLWVSRDARHRTRKKGATTLPLVQPTAANQAEAEQCQVRFLEGPDTGHYTQLAGFVERLAQFYWISLSPGTYEDYVLHSHVLPVLREWKDQREGPTPLPHLAERLEWDVRFSDRVGPLSAFLHQYKDQLTLDTETLQIHLKGDAGSSSGAPSMVDGTGAQFIAQCYMRHVRQQLSRAARDRNLALKWNPAEGYESAFKCFDGEAMDQAAKRLFHLVCPAEPKEAQWEPPALTIGSAAPGYLAYVVYTVLFLAVQQYAENLRQAAHFKKRIWQYLSSALPDFDPLDQAWDSPEHPEVWADFGEHCRQARSLLKYLLTLVDKNSINFADVDDIFRNTRIPSPVGGPQRIPMYTAPKRRVVHWAMPSRWLPPLRDLPDLFPSRSHGTVTEGSVEPSTAEGLASIYEKTFGETVQLLTVLRLFFFVVHGHVLMYVLCLLLNVDLALNNSLWVLCALEVGLVILKTAAQMILFEPHFSLPLLDTAEMALALVMGGAMLWDAVRDHASFVDRFSALFGQPVLNYIFLAAIFGVSAARETLRIMWKVQTGFHTRVHFARMIVLLVIMGASFAIAYFLLLPAVASLGTELCDCNNVASGCGVWDPAVLCYPALFLFHFVMLLSSMMFTAVGWTMVSLVWGLFRGVGKSVGVVRQWPQVQPAMDTLHGDMVMYCPTSLHQVGQDQEVLGQNMGLLALQHWVHLWRRDLVSEQVLHDAFRWKFTHQPPSGDAVALTYNHLNGHHTLYAFVNGLQGAHGAERTRKRIPVTLQSIFGMRAITFFIPVYAETVAYTWDNLKADNTLDHLTDLYHEEWLHFCERVFYGAKPDAVRTAFLAKDGSLGKLFLTSRAPHVQAVWDRIRAWPPGPKNSKWPSHPADYKMHLRFRYFPQDPPPVIPPDLDLSAAPNKVLEEHSDLVSDVDCWAQQQVRWWATLRGQTLGRTVYGLMEMREALVDLTFLELKAIYGHTFLDLDYHNPDTRSTYDDILAWLQRLRYQLFNWGTAARKQRLTGQYRWHSLFGDDVMTASLDKEEILTVVVCGELAMGCFLELCMEPQSYGAAASLSPYELLVSRAAEGEFLLVKLMTAKVLAHAHALDGLVGSHSRFMFSEALRSFGGGLDSLVVANELRAMAEQIVADKFQVLVGAQVYEQQKATYAEINECLSLWKLRHLQFMTAKDDKLRPASYWLRRRDVFGSHNLHSHHFFKPQGGVYVFDSKRLAEFAFKTELRRVWHRLKIGEGKAENQNNMINALLGEVVNILDMNQDAYYSEGMKLQLILPRFGDWDSLRVGDAYGRDKQAKVGKRRKARRDALIGGDQCAILGFKEHIFTYRHSVVGRYMALAEHAFGTIVQRFLHYPHHIRMHYGHPDMTNAHLVRRTGGVSRGAPGVNVNEDIFLAYEMLSQGLDIEFSESFFYGKGRDVEFNAASVFIKKLAQGCVMQLASRQVCDLYLTHLTIFQKLALFYGTLNHFFILYVSDRAVVIYTAMWVLFQVAEVSPNVIASHSSSAGAPWILPLGVLNALPMLLERGIEYTYLSVTDIVFSIPFFSHQNRITADLFSLALQTKKGAYMASGRGLGSTRTSLVDIFVAHAQTNFLPGFRLLLLVIIYCCIGGNILYLLWPLIAAISYIIAPVLYNPKPTWRSLLIAPQDLWDWLMAQDDTFDVEDYRIIADSFLPLDAAVKEKIFRQANLGEVDERQKFVQEWEKAAKGGGQQRSLQTYIVTQWWLFLCDLDDSYNDHATDEVFKSFLWDWLMTSPGYGLDYEQVDAAWKFRGYAVAYGPLREFLAKYCTLGMIVLLPNAESPETILRPSQGPDASALHYNWDIRRTVPEAQLLAILAYRAVLYLFWACLPTYVLLQRDTVSPYNYTHSIPLSALVIVAFGVFYKLMLLLIPANPLSAVAVRCTALLAFAVLFLMVLFDPLAWAYVIVFLLILALIVAYLVEVWIYVNNYLIRRSTPRFINRSFERLGMLMTLRHFPLHSLYAPLFALLGAGLLLLHLALVFLVSLHTTWVFNRRVALRLLPPE